MPVLSTSPDDYFASKVHQQAVEDQAVLAYRRQAVAPTLLAMDAAAAAPAARQGIDPWMLLIVVLVILVVLAALYIGYKLGSGRRVVNT